jgi:tetratricopeptide (TPR) repeat protein
MNRLALLLGVVAACVLVSASVRAADDPLDAAKSLYLSAAYEEALSALANLPPGVDSDQADKFRALCQMALNRIQDAQETLERLATRRPLLKLDEGESPKLIAMFDEARARVLPAAAKALYASAKSNFEQGQLQTAAKQFGELNLLLAEKELAGPTFSDIRMLAEGFAKLTDQQLAAEAVAAKAAAPPPPPPVPTEDASKIFTIADLEVVPPVPLDQTIPQWVPPLANLKYQEFSGVLDVVIDETGAVLTATMSQRLNVMYDQLLLSATKHWRYRPAFRNGKPVKYRKQITVVLRPPTPGSSQAATGQPG